MKLDEIATPKAKAEKKYVVIGNPGRSQPSALYPKTEAPKMYTEVQAKKIADKLNDKPKMTYGVLPSQVHWHVKTVEDAMNYVMGSKAVTSIRMLQHDLNPSDDGWGQGPAKQRF